MNRLNRFLIITAIGMIGTLFGSLEARAAVVVDPIIAPGEVQASPPTAASHAPPLNESQVFSLYGHWDSDLVSNLGGGIRTGSAVDSVAVGGFTLKGDRLGLPRSIFNFSIMATRMGNANARLIGADTNPSNIEGIRNRLVLNTAFWQQNWLSMRHLGLSTRLGMFDLNAEFDSTDSAAQLLNSSFGLSPSLTDNFTTSTFPQNGTGLVANIGSTADPETAPFALKVGIVQGDVDQQTHPFSQGVLNIAEGQWRPNDGTAIKLGGWQKRGNGQLDLHGGYLSAEGPLLSSEHDHISGFVRASYAAGMDAQATGADRYLGAGIDWQAPFEARPDDYFTLGAASLRLNQNGQSERLFEAAYIARLTPHLYLQPDLQYIHNPGGNQPNALPDAWVAIVRLHIE
jgi:porin